MFDRDRVADWLIARAKKTPYFHLPGYMERYWLVPYKSKTGDSDGTGPVSFWKRPVAWLLQRFDIAARIHIITSSDDARAFHDHPWPYLSVILSGGYTEITPVFESGIYVGDKATQHKAGAVLFRRAQSWHRLEIGDQPATTLFITFRYRQRWGFMPAPALRKVYYKDYLAHVEQANKP